VSSDKKVAGLGASFQVIGDPTEECHLVYITDLVLARGRYLMDFCSFNLEGERKKA
jgi:hypothetical protein